MKQYGKVAGAAVAIRRSMAITEMYPEHFPEDGLPVNMNSNLAVQLEAKM